MKALISGIFGQQASYLSEFLLEKGYDVHGFMRSDEITKHADGVKLHICEMTDAATITKLIKEIQPDEIYNLAAMNSIERSFANPVYTMNVNFGGLVHVISAVQMFGIDCKIYQAASSEIFGDPVESPQTEQTRLNPRNPYGISKCAGLQYARIMRSKGTKIYCGILYNNDSPRRPREFLSKKVCEYVASVKHGNKEKLKLGNLDAQRDFGYAKEYAEWTWRILQHHTPDDFIMATGVAHTIRDFVSEAFSHIGIKDWDEYIETDANLYRPSESRPLVGGPYKSGALLNFYPQTSFRALIAIMMNYELDKYKK